MFWSYPIKIQPFIIQKIFCLPRWEFIKEKDLKTLSFFLKLRKTITFKGKNTIFNEHPVLCNDFKPVFMRSISIDGRSIKVATILPTFITLYNVKKCFIVSSDVVKFLIQKKHSEETNSSLAFQHDFTKD